MSNFDKGYFGHPHTIHSDNYSTQQGINARLKEAAAKEADRAQRAASMPGMSLGGGAIGGAIGGTQSSSSITTYGFENSSKPTTFRSAVVQMSVIGVLIMGLWSYFILDLPFGDKVLAHVIMGGTGGAALGGGLWILGWLLNFVAKILATLIMAAFWVVVVAVGIYFAVHVIGGGDHLVSLIQSILR